MKNVKAKKIFLENLKKIPIVHASCERSGISRASVYRWKKEDEKFAKAMSEAMDEGEALINDLSEGQLITLIKDKNFFSHSFLAKSQTCEISRSRGSKCQHSKFFRRTHARARITGARGIANGIFRI